MAVFPFMSDSFHQSTEGFNCIFIRSDLDDAGLTPYEFRVYAHLSRRASYGVAFPSKRSMAETCRISVGAVKRCLRVLLSRGMITRQLRDQKSSLYTVVNNPEKWIEIVGGGDLQDPHKVIQAEGNPLEGSSAAGASVNSSESDKLHEKTKNGSTGKILTQLPVDPPADVVTIPMKPTGLLSKHLRVFPPPDDSVEAALASNPPKPKRDMAEIVPIPMNLDTAEFRAVWVLWMADRKARRHPVTAHAAVLQFAMLGKLGVETAILSIKQSIQNGWIGLFPVQASRMEVKVKSEPGSGWDEPTQVKHTEPTTPEEKAAWKDACEQIEAMKQERARNAHLIPTSNKSKGYR